ncbi:MAG TPA: hypothetical protein VGH12_02575 [Steroidobacteraceae bacterium]|jgi:uncharacterized membrane protein YgcG
MMAYRPTAQQERWIAASSRLRLKSGHSWIAERSGGWKAPSSMARCAFFVLGAVAGGLTAALFAFLHIRDALIPAGVAMLIAAEWLILHKRLFHAGIEEALWAGGLLAIMLDALWPKGGAETGMTALAAIALGLAGIRLLNPLFITLAAMAASLAIDFAGGHRLIGEADAALPASVFCYATAAIALAAGRAKFRRPSHDRMLDWLVVIMPLCGFLWLVMQHGLAIRVFTGLASGAFAVAALVIGLRRRTHAPLIACIVCFACVAYQLRDLTALPLKAKLILWGSAALLLALGLDRYLRTPRRGITSRQLGEGSNALDVLQWVGAATLSPKSAPVDAPFKGGGGNFGGGGAGVRF